MMLEISSFISIGTLRSLSTVLAFVAFIAVCLWAYSRQRREDFEEAAALPFADEDPSGVSPVKNVLNKKTSKEKMS